ncbi:MAG: hypothetical protein AB1393_14630 [Candidatus Edwardsbacteria bacterium]
MKSTIRRSRNQTQVIFYGDVNKEDAQKLAKEEYGENVKIDFASTREEAFKKCIKDMLAE